MDKKKDEIEDLFKDSFDDFEPEVQPKVWKNVKTAVKWGGAGLLVKYILNKVGTNTLVAIVSSAVTVIGTVWIMDNKKSSSENTAIQPNTEVVEVAPVVVHDESPVVETSVNETEQTKVKDVAVKEVENKEPKSFKNTKITEITAGSRKNVRSVINELSEQSIAIIAATPVSGSAPLIVNLTNVGTGVENKWVFSDGQPTTSETNPARAFLAGKHVVILQSKTADGKAATDTIRIDVTDVSSMASPPNVFSPNGDGVADVFSFQSKNMVNMQAEIYDKNSNLIYKWKGTDGAWDGKNLKGEPAPSGNYFYIITAEGIDGKKYEQKAVIKLVR